MKKIFTLMFCAACLFVVSSCCNGDSALTARKAKKLVNKEMERLHATDGIARIDVGYYECNSDEARYKLRQLAANELITYKCDRIQQIKQVRKSRKVRRNYYGYNYYDTEYYNGTDTVYSYFVNVELTDKCKKMVIDSLPEPGKTSDEQDLNPDFEPQLDKYPEYKVDSVEFANGKADTKALDNREPESGEEADDFGVDPDMVEMAPDEDYVPDESLMQQDNMSAYEAAKAREHTETVYLKAYSVKVVKVRNIKVNPNLKTATAEIITECSSSTPFGRILSGVYEGQRDLDKDVPFIYYEDKGWQLNTNEE